MHLEIKYVRRVPAFDGIDATLGRGGDDEMRMSESHFDNAISNVKILRRVRAHVVYFDGFLSWDKREKAGNVVVLFVVVVYIA